MCGIHVPIIELGKGLEEFVAFVRSTMVNLMNKGMNFVGCGELKLVETTVCCN